MKVSGDPGLVAQFQARHIVKEEDGALGFDFTTLIPRPAILDGIVSGSKTEEAVEAITGKTLGELTLARNPGDTHAQMVLSIQTRFSSSRTPEQQAAHEARLAKLTPEDMEAGLQAIQAIEETGYPTWYEWSLAKWGTKWNSYGYHEVTRAPGVFVCRYDTAWSPPVPVWEAMARAWPLLTFEIDSFDEGWGYALHAEAQDGEWTMDDVACDATSYERAYGHPKEPDEDEDELAVALTIEVPEPGARRYDLE